MKAKELIHEIEDAGAVFLRSRGDDRIYRMPDGSIVGIPQGGRQNEVSTGCLGQVRKAFRRAGLKDPWREPQHAGTGDPESPASGARKEDPGNGRLPPHAGPASGIPCPRCSKEGRPIPTRRIRVPTGTRIPLRPGVAFTVNWPADIDHCVRCRSWYPVELCGRAL